MLKNKTVLLGVTGGIAAYKAAALASALVKLHANVEVVMTQNATQFVTPFLLLGRYRVIVKLGDYRRTRHEHRVWRYRNRCGIWHFTLLPKGYRRAMKR